MAIQRNREELERGGARLYPLPEKPKLPVLGVAARPEENAVIVKIAEALTNASAVQRTETMTAFATIGNQLASALSELKRPEGWSGNWDVHITKRDALGRISEVQFRPAKP